MTRIVYFQPHLFSNKALEGFIKEPNKTFLFFSPPDFEVTKLNYSSSEEDEDAYLSFETISEGQVCPPPDSALVFRRLQI
jgi:hypothetical protein